MFLIEEDKHRTAQRIVVHLSGDDTTEAVKTITHVRSARVQVIAAGSRQMQHGLTDKCFEIIRTYRLVKEQTPAIRQYHFCINTCWRYTAGSSNPDSRLYLQW